MRPDSETIRKELCSFISANILAGGVNVEPDTILNDIGVDSFSLIEIILFIERRFKVSIPHESLTPENFVSVNALTECTERYLNAG